ncbi:HAD family hydrolase [Brevibacterium sp. 91QC2O2]|uniref:HAD family hydrolase n=1 Tax=Brevibacterium TaxID=1696 RepID=UPI00211CCC58|nr:MULTISPECIES: HAD family hydrolase [unclassified Brevibacterium]MCQ9369111.1 HAD family hydrolase [Brevibacterium sp. 91QC2O2]MCQ9386468.1 HAD family hydrolase [Brevibacterium sp. 68QC2CO]
MTTTSTAAAQAADATARYLIGLDLDGTVVDYDGVLHEEVRDYLMGLADAGQHVVIATGRAPVGALEVANRLEQTRGYVISSNGAVIMELDPATELGWKPVHVETFDPASALEQMESVMPTALYMVEDENLVRWASEDFPRGDLTAGGDYNVVSFEELKAKKATRIVMRELGGSQPEFAEAVKRIGLHGVTYSVGWSNWLDISPEGISKASALQRVADLLGVDRAHTVAAGDGSNDAEMLDWAGHAIVMGQARDELKELADFVAPPVEEHGLVAGLRSFLG